MKKSTTPGPKTVAEYLAATPEPARSTLRKVRAVIRASVPRDATECISYGVPMFKHNGMVMGFAAFDKHCSLFPGASPIANFAEDLKGFRTSKGTIRFAIDQPFPADLLKKLVRARLTENKKMAAKRLEKKKKGKTTTSR